MSDAWWLPQPAVQPDQFTVTEPVLLFAPSRASITWRAYSFVSISAMLQ